MLIFKHYNWLKLLSIIIFFSACNKKKNYISTTLNENWQFKSTKDKDWLPANVPSSVHSDLIANNKIEDLSLVIM